MFDKKKLRGVLSFTLRDAFRCTCLISFYGSVRFNINSISANAKCVSAEHTQHFKFGIHLTEDNLATLIIKSDHKIKHVYKRDPKNPQYLPLRGKEREEIREKVENDSVKPLIKKVVTKTSSELLEDSHPGNIRKTHVYYKLNSEKKCENRLQLKSFDLADIFQIWIEDSKLKDPFLRFVGLDLKAQMYAEKDLNLLSR